MYSYIIIYLLNIIKYMNINSIIDLFHIIIKMKIIMTYSIYKINKINDFDLLDIIMKYFINNNIDLFYFIIKNEY